MKAVIESLEEEEERRKAGRQEGRKQKEGLWVWK